MRAFSPTLIVLAASLFGCEQPSEQTKSKEFSFTSTSMDFSNRVPTAEAQEKIRLKDYKVYFAMGYAEYFPGIDSQTGEYVRGTYSSIEIEDTSDVIRDGEHEAIRFASKFNQAMVSGMSERGLLPEPIHMRLTPAGFAFNGETFRDPILVVEAIKSKAEGRSFVPIVVSNADMKSDEASQIYSALIEAGYRNIVFEKIEETSKPEMATPRKPSDQL